jgi:hypothetical protein
MPTLLGILAVLLLLWGSSLLSESICDICERRLSMTFILPLGFGSLDFRDWFRGLVSAFVSGGASAVTAAFVAPALTKDLAVGTSKFFIMVGSMFVMSGTLSMMNFLRTQPIPEVKTVTTTTTLSGKLDDSNPQVTTKIQETHTESIPSNASPK